MCLINAKLRVAEEDIICYKVYIVVNRNLLSPYRREKAPEEGIIATTRLGTIKSPNNVVYEGFHSFATLSDAVDESSIWEDETTVIVKCTIPKFSRYYKGIFSKHISYCSECIILNNLITDKICI